MRAGQTVPDPLSPIQRIVMLCQIDAEHGMALGEMEGDVADGMAGRLDHRGAALAERHRVALPHRMVQLRQPVGIRRGADDPAAEA